MIYAQKFLLSKRKSATLNRSCRSSRKGKITGLLFLAAATACNQEVYDGIYKQIIQQALLSQSRTQVTFQRRNNAIEALRALCHGQVSSYEKGHEKNQVTTERFAKE